MQVITIQCTATAWNATEMKLPSAVHRSEPRSVLNCLNKLSRAQADLALDYLLGQGGDGFPLIEQSLGQVEPWARWQSQGFDPQP